MIKEDDVGVRCSYFETRSVLIALGITAAVCIAISLFAIQVRVSLTPSCALYTSSSHSFLITRLKGGGKLIFLCV